MSSVVQLLREEKIDLHVSVSALRTLDGCPRQWLYRYVVGCPAEDVSARLVLGSAVHRALALFYTALQSGEEPPLDHLIGVAGAAISQSLASGTPVLFGAGEDAEGLVNEARRLLGTFVDQGYRPVRVLGVERPFALELTHPETGEVLGFEEKLIGAIDLLAEDADGRAVVVDHKISSRADATKAERADLQMAVYAWATKQILGVDEVGLRYQDVLRTKAAKVVLQDVQRSPHDEAEALEAVAAGLDLVHLAVGSRNARRIMGRRRSWRCKDCGWRRRCEEDRT